MTMVQVRKYGIVKISKSARHDDPLLKCSQLDMKSCEEQNKTALAGNRDVSSGIKGLELSLQSGFRLLPPMVF